LPIVTLLWDYEGEELPIFVLKKIVKLPIENPFYTAILMHQLSLFLIGFLYWLNS